MPSNGAQGEAFEIVSEEHYGTERRDKPNTWEKFVTREKSWKYVCPYCGCTAYYVGMVCKYKYCPWCRQEIRKD